MPAARMKRIGREQRGQIMILGALGVLLVALMMLLTLNVGQSVYEKIRIQQVADSATFSMATQQARTYNFFAYTNRANIGSLVSATSVHAFMSMASAVPEMFNAARKNMLPYIFIEAGICAGCGPHCGWCCKHCIHLYRDWRVYDNYQDDRDDLYDKVERLDRLFVQVINALDAHMFVIAASQAEMRAKILMQILSDDLTKKLIKEFAPQAGNNPGGVIALNSGVLPQPDARGFNQVFETDQDKRQWVPTEIANGSRWSTGPNEWFISDRGYMDLIMFVHPNTLLNLTYKDGKPAKQFSMPLPPEGQARIIQDPDNPKPRIKSGDAGPVGDTAASYDEGTILSLGAFQCVFTMFPFPNDYEAWVSSSKDGGDHEPDEACVGKNQHKFRCLSTSLLGTGCFTLFKAEPDPKKNFGQPVVYSVISQDLRLMEEGGRGPWEITDSGTVGVDLGGDVNLKQTQISNNPGKFGNGVAMSKALVYYHLPRWPDGWKEHPNFFNPYWKAKLQPFRGSMEAAKVLGAAGATKYLPALLGSPLP